MKYHEPVLVEEVLSGLQIKNDGIYVDATFGGGGHSLEILKKEPGTLIAFDQDPEAEANVPENEKIRFVNHNFKYLSRFLTFFEVEEVDGILADLGVSSHQFNTPERGFSLRFEGPLDMRMDLGKDFKAEDLINNYSEEELIRVFSDYGEVRNSKTLAKRIVEVRRDQRIKSTDQLISLIEPVIKGKKHKYLAQVFQAVRIEVNDELDALQSFLEQSSQALKTGGRIAVISFHSLEDRLVKRFLKFGNFSGTPEKDFQGNIIRPLEPVNKKPVTPSQEELKRNQRSSGAKLRIGKKL